jgi:glycosyltransferase involved in cell wall biosynthesis
VAELAPYLPGLPERALAYAVAAGECLSDAEFDLVHCHDWLTMPAGLAAHLRSGRPLVVHVHSTEMDRSRPRPDPGIRQIEALGMAGSDRTVVVSRYARSRALADYEVPAHKVTVVHNGTSSDLPVFFHGFERAVTAEPVVLFLGRITWQKGPLHFVEAAARLRRRLPKSRFVMAGAGDLLPAARQRAQELGLGEAMAFPGFLGRGDVARALAEADVLVMPSESEPFGIVALEAAAYALPVVASCHSGVTEVLPDTPSVEPTDHEGLAECLFRLLRDPSYHGSVARRNYEAARRQTWDVAARELVAIYHSLCR